MWNISGAIAATRDSKLVFSGSHHQCAKSVRSFIEAGGLSTTGRPVSACQYTKFLPTIGFKQIATLIGTQMQTTWTKQMARPGDISVMYHGQHGHICMWDGSKWVSDFRQNNMWPYGGDGTCFIFRYTGEVSGAVDFSGSVQYETNLYGVQYKLEEPDPTIEFKGLYNLYRNLSKTYMYGDLNTYTPQGEIVLGDKTPTDSGLSNYMFNYICKEESGKPWGFTMTEKELAGYDLGDARGHKTYGYGSLYFDKQHFMDQIKQRWTQEELESVYISTIKSKVEMVKSWASNNGVRLSQNQLDSIVSACYNMGDGFLKKPIAGMIKSNPNNPQIREVWSHLSDALGSKYRGLLKRRTLEANWYFS